MLKLQFAACTLASALAASTALAQTTPTPSPQAPAAAPSTGAPATAPSASSMGAGTAMPGKAEFYTNMSANQWRASKFVGVDIYGANNEKIGDVNDIILDKDGTINAVVIGVGGFLGIGEKDVAIPFRTVEWTTMDRNASRAGSGGAMGTNNAPAASNNGAMGTNSSASGNTANTSAAKNSAAGSNATEVTGTTVSGASNATYPDHGVLRMTKQDLQNAPSFHYADTSSARSTGGTQNPVPAAKP